MTLEEFAKDVKSSLMNGSYHYTESSAEKCVQDNFRFIREDFNEGVSAKDCAADIGFCG